MKVSERKSRFADIAGRLDMEAVGLAIRTDETGLEIVGTNPGQIPAFDLDTVGEMVWTAGERWLAEDLERYPFIQVQQKGRFNLGAKRPLSQVLDIIFYDNDKKPWVVVDWKARIAGEVDSYWGYRQSDSWQGKFYLATTGAKGFFYRGVDTKLGVREIPIKSSALVEGHVSSAEVMYESLLTTRSEGPWPMNKPSSCRRGRDYTCQFLNDCHELSGGSPPLIQVRNRDTLSHSFLTSFLDCPERARREELLAAQDEAKVRTYEMDIGRAFDRGVSEVWRQAFGHRCLEVFKEGEL